MKRPAIILVASAALVLVAGSVQAQQVVPAATVAPDTALAPGKSAHVPTPSLFEGMQLTKAQQDSIDAISRRYIKLYNEINQEKSDVHIRTRQFLVLREKSRQERRAVLTPEQQKVFDPRSAAQRADDERISNAMMAKMQKQGH